MSKFSFMANYFFCLFQLHFFNIILKDVENYFISPGSQMRPNAWIIPWSAVVFILMLQEQWFFEVKAYLSIVQ